MTTQPAPDYSVKQVAAALGMSEKWVRMQVKANAEHQRYGHKIRFTEAQLAALRARHTVQTAPATLTTGPRRRAS